MHNWLINLWYWTAVASSFVTINKDPNNESSFDYPSLLFSVENVRKYIYIYKSG